MSSNTFALNISSVSVTFGSIDIGTVVSTVPVTLHSIIVNSAGQGGSPKLEVWDTSVSTPLVGNSVVGIRRIAGVDTTASRNLIYDIICSSGLAIFNQGSTPADVSVIFRER